jgi:hypothetical protein
MVAAASIPFGVWRVAHPLWFSKGAVFFVYCDLEPLRLGRGLANAICSSKFTVTTSPTSLPIASGIARD